MQQPDRLMPGITGSACRTIDSGRVTFSGRRGIFFTISPKGEMSIGPAIHDDRASVELGEMLVDYFGRAHKNSLLKAEARALAAETHVRALESRIRVLEDDLKKAGMKARSKELLDQMPAPLPNRQHGRFNSPSVLEQLDALGRKDE